MPLDDTHRLWDPIRPTPVVFGNRSHFIEREGRRDGVVNVTSFVRNVCVEVIGGAEYKAHVDDQEYESEEGSKMLFAVWQTSTTRKVMSRKAVHWFGGTAQQLLPHVLVGANAAAILEHSSKGKEFLCGWRQTAHGNLDMAM